MAKKPMIVWKQLSPLLLREASFILRKNDASLATIFSTKVLQIFKEDCGTMRITDFSKRPKFSFLWYKLVVLQYCVMQYRSFCALDTWSKSVSKIENSMWQGRSR